jgi:hypothetical protein
MIDDEKLRLLAFEDRWHFVALCCLKADGLLDEPASDLRERRIAVKLGVQLRELDEISRRLREVELIDSDMNPLAWDELQYKSDNSTERVKAYRERQKKQPRNETKRSGNVAVTAQDTDTDTDTDIEEEKKPPKAPRKRWVDKPDCVSAELWADWRSHRKTIFTETALEGFEREADKACWPLDAAIREAIERGWQGFKADWVKDKAHGNSGSGRDNRDGVAKALDRRLGLDAFAGASGRPAIGRGSGDSGSYLTYLASKR